MNRVAALPVSDGLAAPRRHWALIGLWIGMAMSVLDSSIANIGLLSIAGDLGASPPATTWVITAYQIAIVMTLLPVSALGERLGYRQVYLGGLVLFIAMSLACALSGSLVTLAVFRFLQGLGAAAMMGINGALMRYTWPKTLLARGIGYNGVVIAGTAAAGPALAALILSLGRWPWLFLINVPAGLLSLALAGQFLPRPPPVTRSFDWPSALLNAAMFAALFLMLSGAARGATPGRFALTLAIGLGAATWLFGRIRTAPRPLIPLDLIRIRRLRFSYCASLCAFVAQMCLLVSLPFLIERRLGLGAGFIGLLILPMPLGVAAASPLAGRLADKPWAGAMSASGLCLFAAGSTLIAMLLSARIPVGVALGMGLCGAGFGLFQTPNNNVMLKTPPLDRAGAAAGMLSLSRLLGQTLGALLATLSFRMAGPTSSFPLYLSGGAAIFAGFWSIAKGVD